VPLVGVLFFGWSVSTILVAYWLENGAIGVLNVHKILLASRRTRNAPRRAGAVGLAQRRELQGPHRPPAELDHRRLGLAAGEISTPAWVRASAGHTKPSGCTERSNPRSACRAVQSGRL